MTSCRQQLETNFMQLKDGVIGCWSQLKQPEEALSILRDSAQAYIGWTLQDAISAEELLEHLERAAVLSPNSVGILQTMCEIVGCQNSSRLVKEYHDKHPPKASGGQCRRNSVTKLQPHSAPAVLRRASSDQFNHDPEIVRSTDSGIHWTPAGRFGSDFDPPMAGYQPIDSLCGGPESSERDWSTSVLCATDQEASVMRESRESSSEDIRRTMWRNAPGGGGSMWPPRESGQQGHQQAAETEKSRQRSMALWGHAAPSPAAPRPSRPSKQAVCECNLPPAAPRPRQPRLSSRSSAVETVEEVLNLRPTTTAASSSSKPGVDRGFAGMTPAGARRARLVDFLSQRLGPRYLQLGEQLESVSGAELAAIAGETDSDLVSRSRRLLHLYLGRHQHGEVEEALVRRLRRIRFNRLADELERWSDEQDLQEDPRDWPEDKLRWKQSREWPEDDRRHRRQRHDHQSPVRIPRMACC